MSKIIDRAENGDRGAFASENFWHQFWQDTFSAESYYIDMFEQNLVDAVVLSS